MMCHLRIWLDLLVQATVIHQNVKKEVQPWLFYKLIRQSKPNFIQSLCTIFGSSSFADFAPSHSSPIPSVVAT